MTLCPVIKACAAHTKQTKHTKLHPRAEVEAEHRALAYFFGQVHALRFLPPSSMRQSLEMLRQDTSWKELIERQYDERDGEDQQARITYEVAIGHHEYLMRNLEQFLATGTLNKQLCWFLDSHQEPMGHDRRTSYPETASQMVSRVAQQQSAILVDQEQTQAFPYPFLYAAHIVSAHVEYELFQARYGHRDIPSHEQRQMVEESLIAAGYQRS